MLTNKFKNILSFLNEAKNEARKVIWPSFKDTLHTTVIVITITIIMSIILWGLDAILFQLVSFITNLRF